VSARSGRLAGRFVAFSAVAALAAVASLGTAQGGLEGQGSPGGTSGIGATTGVGGIGGSVVGGSGVGGFFPSGGAPAPASPLFGAGACGGLVAVTSPPPSDAHGFVYDQRRGTYLLFTASTGAGGSAGPPGLYEMSVENGTPTWHRFQQVTGPAPSPRFAPGFAYDYRTGRAVLFGGNGSGSGPAQPRDVWEWDGCKWVDRTPAWAPTAAWPAAPGGVWPSSRWAPSMTYDWASERVVLTTGIQNPTFQWETDPADATVYEWDSDAGVFVVRTPFGQPPTDRGGSTAIGDRNRKLVYLVTGLQENESPGGGWDQSLYVWNGASGTWTKRTALPAPSAREFASIYHDLVADRIVITGGVWYGWVWTPDYWQYNPDANAFSLLATDQGLHMPAPGFVEMNRFWSPITYDDGRRVAVQYGGRVAETASCFNPCAVEVLGDTRFIASGGIPVTIPPGSAGASGTVPAPPPPLINIARNTACPSGFPSPLESDTGWGGGALPCEVVDGLLSYDTWSHGLAFTGGHHDAGGGDPYIEPAGVRHAVIDFGSPQTFEKVTIWWHGVEHTPDAATLEYWNGTAWVGIPTASREYGARHADGLDSGYSDSDDYSFAPVTGSKFRYSFDNSGHNVLGTWNVHGWIYEVEVWSAVSAGGPVIGQACTGGGVACSAGVCVDGVCCSTACGGGDTSDCQACSIAAGGAADGTCGPAISTHLCRPAAGGCDVAERCDGSDVTCPADTLAHLGDLCPISTCEAGVCTGASPNCPTDNVVNTCQQAPGAPIGTPCAAASECDSQQCVDGVCCETACGGGDTGDCQACSIGAGGTANGSCVLRTGQTCGATAPDLCETAAICDTTPFCPGPAPIAACTDAPVASCGGGSCPDVTLPGPSSSFDEMVIAFPSLTGTGEVSARPCEAVAEPTNGYKILTNMAAGGDELACLDLEVSPTVTYGHNVQVCIYYSTDLLIDEVGGTRDPNTFELQHDDGMGAGFVPITAFRVPATADHGPGLCGFVDTFSPFAITAPIDRTAPVFGPYPSQIVAYATSTSGALVTYTPPAATDAGDGPVAVSCNPRSGSTFAPGNKTVKCTAIDRAGNAADASFTVWVQYQAPADGTFFLPPINPDGSSLFKGATIPVKFKLTGASAAIGDVQARLLAGKVSSSVSGSDLEAASSAPADSSNLFRYDPAAHQYVYNLSTKAMTSGTWSLRVNLGDEVVHEVIVSVKR